MKYSCYRHSSIIGSLFVYLFLGLRTASPRDPTKVKVEHAGFYSFDRKSSIILQGVLQLFFFFRHVSWPVSD